ncbi:nicotinic acid mononucleotide adenylyltransferase [Anaerobacillus alkalidiazotrophicus]|uniref:Probable nicotinate-nucleotide adenylyltransferase n=1 Tax=Anaerobacillus alkalidiazotrophicus TaxID=472963 RepID=A0A1S2MBL5_9BACI|nr:nicotinate-nucleotide adenylyltransferase [Anaerobacillus alkalidiazotrophicus]OIJ22101.1 nicotinic acid mononucleotide adenylyltransferase [Anaerobacillus alkalidiazotrophicus]
MKRIGIIGGTFDPPHFGHLLIAEQALEECELDEVWFMPTRIPPHKQGSNLCTDEERIEMVERAIESNPSFRLMLVEFERQGPSYTIDTIKELRSRYKDHSFYFIIGGDMIEYLPKWKDIDELLLMVTFVGVKRPGHPCKSIYSNDVILLEAPQLEISSTEIRERLFNGRSVRYLLPDSVICYIKEQGIYGKG